MRGAEIFTQPAVNGDIRQFGDADFGRFGATIPPEIATIIGLSGAAAAGDDFGNALGLI